MFLSQLLQKMEHRLEMTGENWSIDSIQPSDGLQTGREGEKKGESNNDARQ